MGSYICFYVLQEEVSLMVAEQGTDFDYSRLSLGVILLISFLKIFRRTVFGFLLGLSNFLPHHCPSISCRKYTSIDQRSYDGLVCTFLISSVHRTFI